MLEGILNTKCKFSLRKFFWMNYKTKQKGKTKYYLWRIDFQKRESPYVLVFVWISAAPKIRDGAEYKSLIERS